MTDQDRLADIEAWLGKAYDVYGYEDATLKDIAWLVAEVDRCQRLLGRLEWAGTVVFDEWYDKGKCCPVCKGEPDEGHTDNCELAKILGRTQKDAPPQ